jgi:nucleolin
VAQTSGWAQQEEENNTTITLTESEQEDSILENEESNDFEGRVSDWEAEGEDAAASETEAVRGEGERGDEEGFVEPPEEAKIYVGNLPYDVTSEKLAMLFDQAGTVEISEVNKCPCFFVLNICILVCFEVFMEVLF